MTLSMCDQVTERVALGEPLGELAEHAATCVACQRLMAMSSQLGATRHAVDPGLGFSARMTVGAQQRIAARRRRRLAAGLAATVASGAFGVFVVTHAPDDRQASVPDPAIARGPAASEAPTPDQPTEATDTELAALVELADVGRSARVSAKWGRIEQPVSAYKKLLEDLEGDAP